MHLTSIISHKKQPNIRLMENTIALALHFPDKCITAKNVRKVKPSHLSLMINNDESRTYI